MAHKFNYSTYWTMLYINVQRVCVGVSSPPIPHSGLCENMPMMSGKASNQGHQCGSSHVSNKVGTYGGIHWFRIRTPGSFWCGKRVSTSRPAGRSYYARLKLQHLSVSFDDLCNFVTKCLMEKIIMTYRRYLHNNKECKCSSARDDRNSTIQY